MKDLYVDQSKITGDGLYTAEPIKSGEIVAYIHGPVHVFRKITQDISDRMLNWIGVGRYSWINTDQSIFRYVNHSCKPNTALVTKRKVIALENIPANTELTMDYSLTECEPGWVISCCCGTKSCRKQVGPIWTLPRHVFESYLPNIPKNFQRVYKVSKKLEFENSYSYSHENPRLALRETR